MEIEVAKFPWGASGRALTYDRPDGLTKLDCRCGHRTRDWRGHSGHGAGELIAEGVVAIEMGATVRDLAESVHPHPTLSETIMEGGGSFLRRPTART
jgi:dihydrolipoamide dehydrogenase